MMPCGPLSDDWLYWDPETIEAYPHSCALRSSGRDPEQLELFGARIEGSPPPLMGGRFIPVGEQGAGEKEERLGSLCNRGGDA
jgi:hypothetical protein